MHTRRLVTLFLGMWLAGTLFMMSVAIFNLQGVDDLLQSPDPGASQYIKLLGADSARSLLRHQAAELNRFYFDNWEMVQFCLGVAVGILLLFATNGDKLYMGGAGLLVLLVIVEHWLITPQLVALGKALDFLPPDAPAVERARFWSFHNAYSALEVLKILVLLGISGRLLMIQSRRRRRSRKDFDVVNDADNAAVDRG